MNYGFIMDNRSCIGCHACSTACKSENRVPLGVSRTWVKTVETGRFPDSRRHFQVTRCNHCTNPPCARICPVTAMYQRDDGIVEFDPNICIGCKACMQACPYDAIYIDPETHTAAKCHYCAHRVEVGLEPACVVVCPEHAIIAGDMDDPDSEISRRLAREKVTVRKPEQGTAPKVFYIEGNDVALTPTATERTPATFLTADVLPLHPGDADGHGGHGHGRRAEAISEPQPQGLPRTGPINIGQGRMAEHMVQVAYNAQHKIPWHWPVPAYLVTKGISAGLVIVLTLALLTGALTPSPGLMLGSGLISLFFLAATGALLVYDLDRPERFYTILLRPQWRSWLARGAVIITAFSAGLGLWFLAEAGGALGMLDLQALQTIRLWVLGLTLPVAIGTAIYTAYLFGQAEGRDLWQSGLLPVHLLVQSVMAGAAALGILGAVPAFGLDSVVRPVLAAALLADLFVIFLGELGMSHSSEVAAQAAHEITHGRYARSFWYAAIGLGHLLPLLLIIVGGGPVLALAGVLTLVGLYYYEYAYVMAPQEIPNS